MILQFCFWSLPKIIEVGDSDICISCSQQHCSQSSEGGRNTSVYRWMNDTQNVVRLYNGILLRLKKDGNSDTGNNMDEL